MAIAKSIAKGIAHGLGTDPSSYNVRQQYQDRREELRDKYHSHARDIRNGYSKIREKLTPSVVRMNDPARLANAIETSIKEDAKDAVDAELNNPQGPVRRGQKKNQLSLDSIEKRVSQVQDETKKITKQLKEQMAVLKRVAGRGGGLDFFRRPKGFTTKPARGASGLAKAKANTSQIARYARRGANGRFIKAPKLSFAGKLLAAPKAVVKNLHAEKFLTKVAKIGSKFRFLGPAIAILLAAVDPVLAAMDPNAPEDEVRKQIIGGIASLGGMTLGGIAGAFAGAWFAGIGAVPGAIAGSIAGSFGAEYLAEKIYDMIMREGGDSDIKKILEDNNVIQGKNRVGAGNGRYRKTPRKPVQAPTGNSRSRAPGRGRKPPRTPPIGPTSAINSMQPVRVASLGFPAIPRGMEPQVNTGASTAHIPPSARSQSNRRIPSARQHSKRDSMFNWESDINPTKFALDYEFKDRMNGWRETAYGSYLTDQTKDQMPSTYGGRHANGRGVGNFSGSIPTNASYSDYGSRSTSSDSSSSNNSSPRQLSNKEAVANLSKRQKADLEKLMTGRTLMSRQGRHSSTLDRMTDEQLKKLGITRNQVRSPRHGFVNHYSVGQSGPTRADITKRLQGSADVKGVGNTRSAQAMSFLMAKGYPKHVAAGIVGNIKAEGGLMERVIEGKLKGDAGNAHGIVQWVGERHDRFQKVFGKPLEQASFQEQLEYLDWEMKNTEKGAYNKIMQAKDTTEAAALVDQHYERSSGIHRQRRIKFANEFYDRNYDAANVNSSGKNLGPNAAGGYAMATMQAKEEFQQQRAGDISRAMIDRGIVSVNGQRASVSPAEGTTLPARLTNDGTANMRGVRADLVDVAEAASRDLPKGWRAEIISAHNARKTGTKNHPNGLALDIKIYDENNKLIPHNRNSPGWRHYEAFHRSMVIRGKEMHPNQKYIWGGAWQSKAAGNGDPMHMQIVDRSVRGSATGSGRYSFENGLDPRHSFFKSGNHMNKEERDSYDAQVRANMASEKELMAKVKREQADQKKVAQSGKPTQTAQRKEEPSKTKARKVNLLINPTGNFGAGEVKAMGRRLEAKGEEVWYLSDNDKEQAAIEQSLKQLPAGSKINISGWSKGGTRAISVANALEKANIKVDNMDLIDPGQGIDGTSAPGVDNIGLFLGTSGVGPNVKKLTIHRASSMSAADMYMGSNFIRSDNKSTVVANKRISNTSHMTIMSNDKMQSDIVHRWTDDSPEERLKKESPKTTENLEKEKRLREVEKTNRTTPTAPAPDQTEEHDDSPEPQNSATNTSISPKPGAGGSHFMDSHTPVDPSFAKAAQAARNLEPAISKNHLHVDSPTRQSRS